MIGGHLLMLYELQNKYIKIKVNTLGAELKSLYSLHNNKEYLWSGNPDYWKRSAPILFPFVGRLNKQQYRYNGKTYKMGQHGFARDKEFQLIEKKDNKLSFLLTEDKQSYAIYPFKFNLTQEYELQENKLIVSWKVTNTDKKLLYFSIGAHPAFICPFSDNEKTCRLKFNTDKSLSYRLVNKDSLLADEFHPLILQDSIWQFTKDVFNKDAYILENYQINSIALLNKDNDPYLTIHFQSPVVGIWSPAHKNAPFICLEPWYGRCDAENFAGKLKDRDFSNALPGGSTFSTQYEIEINL